MIKSLSKKKRKREGKRERKIKHGKGKGIGKKKRKRKDGIKKENVVFGSHRKISKTFLGKKSYFFPRGKEYHILVLLKQ